VTATPAPPRARRPTQLGTQEAGALGDTIYRVVITGFALLVPALLAVIAISIGIAAAPALARAGLTFITSSTWDVGAGEFGAAPAIYGTLVSSLVALILATPLALGVAIFLSEIAPKWLRQPVAFLVDLLAAVPSVVYGLWAIFFLIPLLRDVVTPFLRDTLGLGVLPIFAGTNYGYSMLAAGVILAIMILPYISAVAREVLLAVPQSQRDAALALGATRWETIRDAVLPYAKSGIVGAVILGLGRALGETMAVTMVIGNRPEISASLLSPGYTMASLIANEFTEATTDLHLSALMAVGAVLFFTTLVVNAIARWLVWRVGRGPRPRPSRPIPSVAIRPGGQ
jgi:phosphate transport system permease protein